jgi:hypothetical protein
MYPADGATGVPINTNIVFTFDQPVYGHSSVGVWLHRMACGLSCLGGGSSGDIWILSTDVSEAASTVRGLGTNTVTMRFFQFPPWQQGPTMTLQPFTEYYVTVPGLGLNSCGNNSVFVNAAGDPYAGFCDLTTLNFTTGAGPVPDAAVDSTAPTLVSSSPANDATGVTQNPANITLTFNEPVYRQSGQSLTIHYASDDSVFASFDGNAITGAINAAGWDLNGNIAPVIISPKYQTAGGTVPELPAGTEFYINIPSTMFKDWSGNNYAGITDSTTLTFTTSG